MRTNKSSSPANPFAVDLSGRPAQGRKSFFTAAKYLVIVLVAFTIALVVTTQSQKWLLGQLTANFTTLAPEVKIQRLLQIAELDPLSIEHLVKTLNDENLGVARTANNLLHDSLKQWTISDPEQLHSNHSNLVWAIKTHAIKLPAERTGWVTSLLQQSMLETADQQTEKTKVLNKRAADVLAKFSLTDRANGAQASRTDAAALTRRVSAKPEVLSASGNQPLPVSSNETDRWINWPPAKEDTDESNQESFENSETPNSVSDPIDSASIYRSTTTQLQMVPGNQQVNLQEFTPQVPSSAASNVSEEQIFAANYLVDSPLQTLDVTSVIAWLGDPDLNMRRQAELELMKRGMSQREIGISKIITSGDVRTRLDLIDSLAASQVVDPRFWLGMLLTDSDRDVKTNAINVLATMDDPKVKQLLHLRLAEESDPVVVAKLRQLLQVR